MNRNALREHSSEFLSVPESNLFYNLLPRIPVGALILITGAPGTGKTSMVYQFLDNLLESKAYPHQVYSLEQSEEITNHHLDRLGIAHIDNFKFDSPEIPEEKSLLFLDSVDQWAFLQGQRYPDRAFADRTKQIARQHLAMFAIQHKTKSGVITGAAGWPQLCDIKINLRINKDSLVIIETEKNRYGPLTELAYEHCENGLRPYRSPFEKFIGYIQKEKSKWGL